MTEPKASEHNHTLIWVLIYLLSLQCGMCSGRGCIEDRVEKLEQHCK